MSSATETEAAGSSSYKWVVLGMLCFIYIFNFLDRQLMSILIEPIKAEMGFTDTQMGYMTGFWFALFYTGFGVIVGFLADRTSRVRILFGGVFLWSLFTSLCGLAQNYIQMLMARIGVGVGEAAGAPPSYSIISDYFPPERRGLALALFSLGVPLGQSAAVAFGAQIDIIWGWRTAFISIGIAGIIASFLLIMVVKEPKRGAMDATATVSRAQAEANAAVKSSFSESLWNFFSRPMLLWTALGCGLCAFVGYAALTWNAAYLLRVMGISREELSIWYALMLGVSMGLGTWWSGAIVDFLAKRSKVWYAMMPAAAMLLAIPFWVAYLLAPTWQLALAFLAIPTFFTIMYLAPALAVVQNSVKPNQRTISGAILLMVLNIIGLGGGPTVVGTLSDMFAREGAAAGMEAVEAASHGLRTSLLWMTPFFVVAVFFLLLQAAALKREIKAAGAVFDRGARLGIVLLLLGVAGLGSSFWLRGMEGLFLDVMTSTQTVLLVISTVLGTFLCLKAMGNKPAAAG